MEHVVEQDEMSDSVAYAAGFEAARVDGVAICPYAAGSRGNQVWFSGWQDGVWWKRRNIEGD